MEDRREILQAVKKISRITGIEVWKLLELIEKEITQLKYK